MIWLNVILFAIGLFLLIKGGDWFVDGSTGIAKRFHIPEILIGATVVSIGTTLPEVMVSFTDAVQGGGQTAYGNAVGSIVCNTALIAAITIAIKPSKADKKSLRFPVIFFFYAAAFYAVVAYVARGFERWVGIVLLLGFIGYMAVQVFQALKNRSPKEEITTDLVNDVLDDPVDDDKQSPRGDFLWFILVGASLVAAQVLYIVGVLASGGTLGVVPENASFGAMMNTFYIVGIVGALLFIIGLIKFIFKNKIAIINSNVIYMIFGAATIAIGATALVDNGQVIAKAIGVPEAVIALTFIALGTSLPELVTAVTALIKGHSSLSLGNIIGANIFNLVLVSGAAITGSSTGGFSIPTESTIAGIPSSLVVDLPLVFVAMGILTIPTIIRGKLSRWQGIVLLVLYAAFCALQFIPMS